MRMNKDGIMAFTMVQSFGFFANRLSGKQPQYVLQLYPFVSCFQQSSEENALCSQFQERIEAGKPAISM